MNSFPANALIRRFGVPLLLFPWLLCGAALFGQAARPAVQAKKPQAGESGPAATAAADYSSEPYVYEKVLSKVAFAKDDTETADSQVVAKVQSQAGVQNFSILSFPYASADEKMTVVYVRVRKADGTVVDTPLDSIQDMPAAITREAPYYSDLREKQVAVKGLEPGDTLEYEYRSRQKPLTPGQFWYDYDFIRKGIALDEELRVSVPENRSVIVGGGPLKPTVAVGSGRRNYTWKTSRLHHETGSDAERARKSLDAPPADVEITSFRNWAEVGEWYGKLAAPRAAVTPAILAKEQTLTKGMTSDADKLRAIYNYVSLEFRYVGVAFGIGRYQPHTAGDVLNNDYGDCKDKETLLGALLAAAGIKAYPALINSSHKIDPGVPSPGQFDHVIAAVPQEKGYQWLDATPGVAPAGYLLPNLRDKEALVIPDHGPPQLVKTGANPPYKTRETFAANAKLNMGGTLDSDMKVSMQDDGEILLRVALRATPETKWNRLLQAISYAWGFGGKVTNATFSAPDTTDPALKVSYHYTRKNYPSWTDGKITLPLPPFRFAKAKKDKTKTAAKPVKLGPPGDRDYTASVALPAGYTPVLPTPKNLVEDFAEYHTRYSFAKGVLHGERELIVKTAKVPVARLGAYRKFVKAVSDDDTAYISLHAKSVKSGAASAPGGSSAATEKAMDLYQKGRTAFQRRDLASAANFFRKAITANPKYAEAWSGLGAVHLTQGNVEQGLSEMKRAITVDPKNVKSYKMLAHAESLLHRANDALETWRRLEKIDPSDGDAPEHIGELLVIRKRYAEAVPELEKAVKRDPTNGQTFLALGFAELHTKQASQAFAAFKQGLDLDPSAANLNNVAYDLAEANQHLDAALGYAKKAVQQVEQKAGNVSLDSLSYPDLHNVNSLGAYWDTLGWVDYRLEHYAEAEKYLRAAWQLSQSAAEADHLGQVCQKEGKTREAGRYYALALAAPRTFISNANGTPQLSVDTMPETHRRLVGLLKSESRAFRAVDRAREVLIHERTVRLPKLTRETATAEFFVLFAAGPEVTAVKFASGSKTLRSAAKRLHSLRYHMSLPDAGPEKIVRRGVLSCEAGVPYCQFILMTPDSVRSIQ